MENPPPDHVRRYMECMKKSMDIRNEYNRLSKSVKDEISILAPLAKEWMREQDSKVIITSQDVSWRVVERSCPKILTKSKLLELTTQFYFGEFRANNPDIPDDILNRLAEAHVEFIWNGRVYENITIIKPVAKKRGRGRKRQTYEERRDKAIHEALEGMKKPKTEDI